MMKNKKNKLIIFGTGNPYLNTQVMQINPGPELVIKEKGENYEKNDTKCTSSFGAKYCNDYTFTSLVGKSRWQILLV